MMRSARRRPSLHVTGTAAASVAPDKVDLMLTVSTDAETPLERSVQTSLQDFAPGFPRRRAAT